MRRCFNCKFWSPYSENDKQVVGYCKMKPMHFAFTLKPTVFTITKDFYLCEDHKFSNEEILKNVSESVRLADALKSKRDIVKNSDYENKFEG